MKYTSISPEKYEAISRIREKFIQVLVKKHKIQIQEVSFFLIFSNIMKKFILILLKLASSENRKKGNWFLFVAFAMECAGERSRASQTQNTSQSHSFEEGTF